MDVNMQASLQYINIYQTNPCRNLQAKQQNV